MEIEAVLGLVAARVRVGEGLALIGDMTQQMAAPVLGHRCADMGGQAPVDQAAFRIGVAIARDTADQDHTQPVRHPIHEFIEARLEGRDGEGVGGKRDLAAGGLRRLECGVDFVHFRIGKPMQPANIALDFGADPGVRCRDRVADDFNHVVVPGRSFGSSETGIKIYRECGP